MSVEKKERRLGARVVRLRAAVRGKETMSKGKWYEVCIITLLVTPGPRSASRSGTGSCFDSEVQGVVVGPAAGRDSLQCGEPEPWELESGESGGFEPFHAHWSLALLVLLPFFQSQLNLEK